MLKTGNIWKKSNKSRTQVVRRVCEALEHRYGYSRLGNPENPLDDLIYIIISNKTTPEMTAKIYSLIKKNFLTWDKLLNASLIELKSILEPAGLAGVKSQQIISALKKIKNDFGHCAIDILNAKSDHEVQNYLVSLPGVSEKVAKCVMMYTMDRKVLPVDSHVHRIANRLGWVSRKRSDQCHAELEAIVPPNRRYAFHVDCILHGRSVCRPKEPKCKECCIYRHCEYAKNID